MGTGLLRTIGFIVLGIIALVLTVTGLVEIVHGNPAGLIDLGVGGAGLVWLSWRRMRYQRSQLGGPTPETQGRAVARPERPAYAAAIAQVVEAAFGSPAEARLVAAVRASEHFVPELSIVAEVDGRVVGHVMLSHVTLRDDADPATADPATTAVVDRQVASLSPLAVLPELQSRGIGSALVRAVTARADELGEPLVVVEGDPAYYGRFGFEPATAHGIQIALPSWAPPEAAQVMRLANDDPALRGRVVYPPAFDEFADH